MDTLKEMRAAGEVIDVTPDRPKVPVLETSNGSDAVPQSKVDDWLDEHLD